LQKTGIPCRAMSYQQADKTINISNQKIII